MRLIERCACPTCEGISSATAVDLPYDRDPVRGYLDRFYGGRPDFDVLNGCRFVVDRCLECGLMFQRFIPDDELFDAVYGRWIDHGSTARVLALKGFEVRRQHAFQVIDVVKYFRRKPGDIRMLDFGMGWGNWVQMAEAFGCAVEGTESNPVQLESAHRRSLTTVPPDALAPERYDFINTEQVFEHLVDPSSVGQRLVESLRPGGVLRISVPNGGNVPALLANPNWIAPKGHPQSLNAITPLEHVNTFTHESLRRFGRRLGLEPFTFPLRVHLDQWQSMRSVLGAFVRRVRPARGTLLYFERPQ